MIDLVANARIIDLLAQGIKPPQVLSIIGCSPIYLKGLIEQEEFKQAVELKAKSYLVEADEEKLISNVYLSLEHKILEQIMLQTANAEMKDNVRALEVVGNRQDKIANRKVLKDLPLDGRGITVNQVFLTMPAHAIPEYTLNSNKEVTTIDNKPMNAMTSVAVKNMFDRLQGKTPIAIIDAVEIVEQVQQAA